MVRFQFHGDFEVGRRGFMVSSFVARPVTASAKSPIAWPVLYHQHTANRWGIVASMGLNHMTTAGHDHYQFEPLAQVSDFKTASISSPTLQSNGFQGESKASIDIPIRSSSRFSDADHALAACSDTCTTAHAIPNTTAHIATHGMVPDRQRVCDTSANAHPCCRLLSQVEDFVFIVNRN